MARFTPEAKTQILAALPGAAAWIDRKPRPPRQPQTATRHNPAPVTTMPPARANKFAAECVRCHGHVAEAQGILAKSATGKWLVFHADGQCPDKQPTETQAQAVEAPKTPRPDRALKPNMYGGKCTGCGTWVEAEQGLRHKTATGWNVIHNGPCPETAPAAAVTPTTADGGERIELSQYQIDTLPLGYYTAQLDNGDYRTFRIRIKSKGQRNAGKAEVCFLGGPNNEADYWLLGIVEDGALVTAKPIRNKVLRDTLMILLGDPHAAQLGFARASKHCYKCGQPLTTPESLDRGIGPDCASK